MIPTEIGSAVSIPECEKLAELGAGKVCLELGSFYGRSSIVLAQVATELHCVDWHRGEVAGLKDVGMTDSLVTWRDNVMRYGLMDKIVMHVGTTDMVLPRLAGSFDFVFVDADHSYEGVKRDILNLSALVETGATLMFHDYVWEELGVKAAVDAFVELTPDFSLDVFESCAIVRV